MSVHCHLTCSLFTLDRFISQLSLPSNVNEEEGE